MQSFSHAVTAHLASNTLWGLAHFDWYDRDQIRALVLAFFECINSSKPHMAVQLLWALAKLGWHDEAGPPSRSPLTNFAAAVYYELYSMITCTAQGLRPHDLSIVMYSIARLGL